MRGSRRRNAGPAEICLWASGRSRAGLDATLGPQSLFECGPRSCLLGWVALLGVVSKKKKKITLLHSTFVKVYFFLLKLQNQT